MGAIRGQTQQNVKTPFPPHKSKKGQDNWPFITSPELSHTHGSVRISNPLYRMPFLSRALVALFAATSTTLAGGFLLNAPAAAAGRRAGVRAGSSPGLVRHVSPSGWQEQVPVVLQQPKVMLALL